MEAAPNVALIALTAALGAVQLAAVLAKPIPQYAEGTDDHKGGLAVVGDAGKHELVMFPGGGFAKTPDYPTLVNLPKHTKIEPDYDKAVMEMAALSNVDFKKADLYIENMEQIKLLKESNRILRVIAGKNTVVVNKTGINHNRRYI